jgi:PAS domain S-box-containing protein
MNWFAARKITGGFAATLLVLGLNAWWSFSNIHQLIAKDAWIAHTFQVRANLEALINSVVEGEGAVRGYLINGDDEFLKSYRADTRLIPGTIARLRYLTRDNPSQQQRLSDLDPLVAHRLDLLEKLILSSAGGTTGKDTAKALVSSGRKATDAIRKLLMEMESAEARLLELRTEQSEHSGRIAVLSLIIASAMNALLLCLIYYLVHRDIIWRELEQTKLKLSEEKFRRIFQYSADQISIVSLVDDTFLDVNNEFVKATGFAREEMIGKKTDELSLWLNNQQRDRIVGAYTKTGFVKNEEADFRRKDGSTFPALLSLVVIEFDGQPCTMSMGRDITDLKRRQEQLKDFATNLERSNRDLEDFARVASHDLQEPLRKIQAFGDRLTAKYRDVLGEQGRDYLDRMRNAAGRGETLIQDLLTFSRVSSKAQPFVRVDLSQVAKEVLSDLELRISESRGSVEVGDLPVVDADPTQMRQLLQNLIGNALKFHRKDTAPEIRVTGKLLNGVNGNGVSKARGLYELTVEDNGIGFEEQYAERIFKIFQRLHSREAYEGTGIGLAVCRKIVERHGGEITATSSPGFGATFKIRLPAEQIAEVVEWIGN